MRRRRRLVAKAPERTFRPVSRGDARRTASPRRGGDLAARGDSTPGSARSPPERRALGGRTEAHRPRQSRTTGGSGEGRGGEPAERGRAARRRRPTAGAGRVERAGDRNWRRCRSRVAPASSGLPLGRDRVAMSAVVTVGVFDGLHLGHQQILKRALARRAEDRCVVVSFDPHPDLVLSRNFHAVPPLTPLTERRERILAMGLDALDVVPFTRELAALPPERFVQEFLIQRHAMRALVVGENFALGRGRAGNVAWLRSYGDTNGFEVEAVPLLELDGAPVTSTRVRGLLAEGRVAEAARLFGRRYSLAGRVVAGHAVGRTL